jgi:RNA recognition motif-containing protein
MNIHISGLSCNIDEDDLRMLFEEYGKVASARVINDRETGKCRGFGFVEMTDDADAQTAIEELNGSQYDNNVISVAVAHQRSERPPFGGGNRNRRKRGGFGRNNGLRPG